MMTERTGESPGQVSTTGSAADHAEKRLPCESGGSRAG